MRFERTAADIEVDGFDILSVCGGNFMYIAAGVLGEAVADSENLHADTPFSVFFSITPIYEQNRFYL